MIAVELSREDPWPPAEWEALATRAVRTAVARTPHGPLADTAAVVEVSVRLTSDEEVRTLNKQYRHKDKPTNVLSFPMVQPDLLDTVSLNSDDGELLLGDIVLASWRLRGRSGRARHHARDARHAFDRAWHAAPARL